MALIKCPECGRENVSDKAEMCPDCGYGIKAHFDEIEREKEAERKKLEEEKEMEELQKWKEEREQAELNTIKMPEKPNLGKILLKGSIIPLIPVVCIGPVALTGIGFFVAVFNIIFWFLTIIWLWLSFSKYNDEVKGYERAQQDFEKYQKEELSRKKMQQSMATNTQSTDKDKDASVVGRAVVGGILAGPAGAVVGAISAADKNAKKNNNDKK